MILLTGATGFIGRWLLPALADEGLPARILLKPSPQTPRLPVGETYEVALASLGDRRGLRAAMVGVDQVIHLASAGGYGHRGHLHGVDVEGARNLAEAAADAGVSRLLFLSHLGADRFSAYPELRAKALAEEAVRSRVPGHTILRSAVVFGAGDRLTTSLALIMAAIPVVFPLPGDGSTLLQPLWIKDLTTAMLWALNEPDTAGRTFEVGGPEFLPLRQVAQLVMQAAQMNRVLVPMSQPLLRLLVWSAERILPRPPVTTLTLDYLATNRTTELDSVTNMIGLQPARMQDHLGYLRGRNWGWELLAQQFSPGRKTDPGWLAN